jgi:hypothetical protein
MMRRATVITSIFCLAILYGLGIATRAAPFLLESREIHDQIRSLANVKRIELTIEPMPADIEAAGVSAKSMRRSLSRRLKDAGFVVTQGEDGPVLRFRIATATHDTVPQGIAINLYMALHQRVRIHEIDEDLMVPTWMQNLVGLETMQNVGEAVTEQADVMIDTFIARCAAARHGA